MSLIISSGVICQYEVKIFNIGRRKWNKPQKTFATSCYVERKYLKISDFWQHYVNMRFLLKLVFAIFYEIFIFSANDSPSKTEKYFLFHPKSSFHSQDIQIFVSFPLSFYTFQIQKDKWKWNNLCYELACINCRYNFWK